MRCDRCCSFIESKYIPGDNYPIYDITERLSTLHSGPVNLCLKCSQEFKEWLRSKVSKVEYETTVPAVCVNTTTGASGGYYVFDNRRVDDTEDKDDSDD